MPQFGVDLRGVGHGVGDFLAKNRAKAPAKPMKRDAEGGFGKTETGGEVGVGRIVSTAGQGGGNRVEPGGAIGGDVLGAKPGGGGVEESEGPGSVIGGVGSEARGRVGGEGVGGVVGVGDAAAAFACAGTGAFVGEVVFEGCEEPGAKATPVGAGGAEGVASQQRGEKPLDKVLGIRGRQAAAPGVGEKGGAVE